MNQTRVDLRKQQAARSIIAVVVCAAVGASIAMSRGWLWREDLRARLEHATGALLDPAWNQAPQETKAAHRLKLMAVLRDVEEERPDDCAQLLRTLIGGLPEQNETVLLYWTVLALSHISGNDAYVVGLTDVSENPPSVVAAAITALAERPRPDVTQPVLLIKSSARDSSVQLACVEYLLVDERERRYRLFSSATDRLTLLFETLTEYDDRPVAVPLGEAILGLAPAVRWARAHLGEFDAVLAGGCLAAFEPNIGGLAADSHRERILKYEIQRGLAPYLDESGQAAWLAAAGPHPDGH